MMQLTTREKPPKFRDFLIGKVTVVYIIEKFYPSESPWYQESELTTSDIVLIQPVDKTFELGSTGMSGYQVHTPGSHQDSHPSQNQKSTKITLFYLFLQEYDPLH